MRLPIIVLSLLLPVTTALGGGLVVFDPSNYSQNVLTAAQTLKSNLHEAQALLNQAIQLQNEARSLARFPVEYWNRVQANYEQLKTLAQGGASLGEYLARVNSQFDQLYPGYQSIENYGEAVKSWTSNTLKMANGVFDTTDKQRKLVGSTISRTQEIVAGSAAGDGLTQQLQSQVSLSAQMVGELQKLQMLQSEQATLQASFIAGQVQDKASERKATEDWLKKPYKPFL